MAKVQITDLERNTGIIAFKENQAKILKTHHLHLHTVDLEKFQSSFENLKHTLKILKTYDTTKQFHDILEARMNSLSEILNRIKPIKRTRRGIFNPLGTFIKSITGNLDDNDLNEIRQAIDETNQKANSLIKNNERQIEINKEFENRMNEIINRMNEQQTRIIKKLSEIENEEINSREFHIRQNLHATLFNMETLENQLKDIFDAVQFSKLGILSKAILSPNETIFALKELEKSNIPINHVDQIYEFLEIQVFHENTKIIFVIKVPIFLPGYYDYIKFESLPHNNQIIPLDYSIAIVSNKTTFVTKQNCKIIEKYRICNYQDLINITEDGCIHNALRGLAATCLFTNYKGSMQIKQINTHTILIKDAVQPIILDSNCDVKNRTISGTLLITFKDCIITINNEQYDAEITTGDQQIELIPMIGVNFTKSNFLNQTDVKQLETLHITNGKHIAEIKIHQTTFKHATIGGFSILTLVSCSLAIWILLSLKKTNIEAPTIKVNFTEQNQLPEPSHSNNNGILHRLKIRDESFHRGEKLHTTPHTQESIV